MKVSLLISTYNGESDIDALLRSIRKLDTGEHTLEVILRDDNSSDQTVALVIANHPWVRMLKGSETVGFVGSNNILREAATGDILCCVNQDTILHPNFVVAGVEALAADAQAVAVNSNMIMPWVLPLEKFLACGDPAALPAFEYQMTHRGLTKYVPADQGVRPTNFVTGGGFFVRSDVLQDDEHLFDPNISMYCEDNDLSMRLLTRGRILFVSGAILYHNQRNKRVSSIASLRKLLRITANRFYVLSKHKTRAEFIIEYPGYAFGIIEKMGHLGLRLPQRLAAYVVGAILALGYLLIAPYWIVRVQPGGQSHDETRKPQ